MRVLLPLLAAVRARTPRTPRAAATAVGAAAAAAAVPAGVPPLSGAPVYVRKTAAAAATAASSGVVFTAAAAAAAAAGPAKAAATTLGRTTRTRKFKARNPTNLNALQGAGMAQRPQASEIRVEQPVEVHFQRISERLCALISGTPYVVGCVAWLSDTNVLAALAGCKGVSFVVTNDSFLNAAFLQDAYERLPRMPREGAAVQCLGLRTGPTRSLMHHKFLVGLDAQRAPLWVAAGSYNISKQAHNNLESIFIFHSPPMAAVFFNEFRAIRAVSKPIRVVAPKTHAKAAKAKRATATR